ncbi:MAG TPA: translation initiation factor IF-3 [Candidatus Udaeobacter sp.]|nr:translation initiation factor IF-3 [Candidatus Udaeobacter sp.]
MRISHKKHKPEPKKTYFFNAGITVPEVLVLNNDGTNLGVMKPVDGVRLAKEQELDLVLINPKTTPPVAKIIDFGQFKYQQEKEERLKQAHAHVTEVKGIRLSLRISPHDMKNRENQTIEFLNDGDKVKIEIFLKGREMQQKQMAREIIEKFINNVNILVPVRKDQEIESQFNKVTAIIAKR